MMFSFPEVALRRRLIGLGSASVSFLALGTVSALWKNPFFARMTVVGSWEFPTLIGLSILTGVFAAVRRPACPINRAGAGNFAGFIGIACPTCNKILMLIFGGEALMRWFDPVRPLLAVLGMALLVYVIVRELNVTRPELAKQ